MKRNADCRASLAMTEWIPGSSGSCRTEDDNGRDRTVEAGVTAGRQYRIINTEQGLINMAHRSKTDILAELATSPVHTGERYTHYKTQTTYIVKDIVFLEATDELAVAYYDPKNPELTWIRAMGDFMATVDGGPRFTRTN